MKISILEWGKSIARVSAKRRIPNGGMNSTPLRFLSSGEEKRKKSSFLNIWRNSERKRQKKKTAREKKGKKERKKEREKSVASLTERELENIYRLENKISGREEKKLYSTIISSLRNRAKLKVKKKCKTLL